MADAVGSRNIWDSLDRLQSNSGESPKSDESRSRHNATKASVQKGQNLPEKRCAQVGSSDSGSALKPRKVKPREPVSLLATMQRKLKINSLNLQQKASGSVVDTVQVAERPLDLSKRIDDSARVTESPLDLSLKRESESILSSYLSVQAYNTSAFKTEETLCITNRANQCGGSISISKPFPVLPCTQKKVSPVRPIIGGKPVVTDSNGNIPQKTVTETNLKRTVTETSSKRNVFSVISIPTPQDIFVLNSSSDTGSTVRQHSSLKSGLKEIRAHTSDSPVCELNAGENCASYSDPIASVIDYCSNDFLFSSCPTSTVSCNSLSNSMCVPDLVRSTFGSCLQKSVDACSNLPRETCLNIPTYKFQKKHRALPKKASKASMNGGDANKRKSVPLAEVRPSFLLPLTSTKPTVSLVNSETKLNSENDLPSCFADELKVVASNANPAEPTLDTSRSPPQLSTVSPLNKSSGGCSNASVLLSPQMPILSPHALAQSSHPASSSSSLHRMDHSHPIYSFSSCSGNSTDTTSTTDTRSAFQCMGSPACASALSEDVGTAPQIQSNATIFKAVLDTFASSYKRNTTTDVETVDLTETDISVKDSCTDLPRPMETDIHEENCALDSKPEKRNVLESISSAVNAFMVNSEFARDVYKKSKLNFYAALAIDFEACSSENRRPCKDMILKTKYYKLIAQKFGFSAGAGKDLAEPILQHKSPLKSTREIDPACRDSNKSAKNKLWSPEHGPAAKDVVQTRAESLGKSSGKRCKSGQPDVKSSVNDECASAAGTSQVRMEIVSTQKVTRSSKRKSGAVMEDECRVNHNNTADTVHDSKSEVSPKRRKVIRDTAISTYTSTPLVAAAHSLNVVDSNKNSLNMKTESSAANAFTNSCSGKIETRLTAKQKSTTLSKKEKLPICKEIPTNVSSSKETKEIKSELTDLQTSEAVALCTPQPSPSNKRTRKRFGPNFVPESSSVESKRCEKGASSGGLSSRSQRAVTRECRSKEPEVTIRKRICVSPDVSSTAVSKAEMKSEVKLEASQSQNEVKTEEIVEIKSEIEDDEFQSQNERNDEPLESNKKKSRNTSAKISRSLLRELENSDGYVAERRTPRRSDNLFMDSRYLTREERSIQMQLMRITQLEVKEEWSKVKEKKECPKTKHCSPKRPEQRLSTRGKSDLCEAISKEEFEKNVLSKEKKKSENNVLSKEKKKLTHRSKLESSTLENEVALKYEKKKIKKKIVRPATASRYSSISACKNVHRKQEFIRSNWMSQCIEKTAKKSHNRLRCRWQSGIWKKKPKSPLKPNAHSEKTKLTLRDKIHQSLTVDVNFPASRMSLSPCSGVSSKLSPCSTVEKANTRDDDVISMSSSMTESSFPRRTIPAEVKKLVCSHATGETVLHRAARLGYPDVALWCCKARYVDVNAKDFAGYTPLHETVVHSNVAIARYLIHYGADLNCAAERRGGTRPLHEAVDCSSTEMVRLLLSAGADINLATYSGRTVHDAAHNPNMKEFLNAYIADITGGTETEWHFRPSWDVSSEDDSIELGMDLLAHAPDDIELDDQMVTFECSEKPFVPAYVLRVHKEEKPRTYMLLCDVLGRLQTTKSQLLLDFPDVVLERIAKEYLFSQIVTMDCISRHKMDEIKLKCDDQFVDILTMTSQLQSLLDIDVISINCCKVECLCGKILIQR